MKKSFVLFSVIFIGFLVITAASKGKEERMQGIQDIKCLDLSAKPLDIQSPGAVKPDLNFGKFPLYFIFNKGQVNKKAKFYAKASRYTLWLTKEGLIFDSFIKTDSKSNSPHSPNLDATKTLRHQGNTKDKEGIHQSSHQFKTHYLSPDSLTEFNRDAFVIKIDTNQSGVFSLIYSTYLGGTGDDYGLGIAANDSGNAYVTGFTGSTDFPTLHQYQRNQPINIIYSG